MLKKLKTWFILSFRISTTTLVLTLRNFGTNKRWHFTFANILRIKDFLFEQADLYL